MISKSFVRAQKLYFVSTHALENSSLGNDLKSKKDYTKVFFFSKDKEFLFIVVNMGTLVSSLDTSNDLLKLMRNSKEFRY